MTRSIEHRRKQPHERLADSLEILKNVLVDGIYRSNQIPRRDFERLMRSGYLREILRGWYHVTNPAAPDGTTIWQGHYWPFISQYLGERFEDRYCLGAEASLLVQSGLTEIPHQIVVLVEKNAGATVGLPNGRSILPYKDVNGLPESVETLNGVKVMSIEEALSRAPHGFFKTHSLAAASVLATVGDSSAILRLLLDRGATVYAGRLIGAFRHIGDIQAASRIASAMKSAGYEVTETNPFERPMPAIGGQRLKSPYVARLRLMWGLMRDAVIHAMPPEPGMPQDAAAYLKRVDELARTDAYHSLSIEGYRVDDALIERVRSNSFDPDKVERDRQQRDALAARGYYDTSLEVRSSIESILWGADAATLVREAHHGWFEALFRVCVQAGILKASDLAGYRHHQVYIAGSNHVPVPTDAVVDSMECLFDLLAEEESAAVRAILGHFVFGFVHPYGDGNGRLARFLMNTMLASGGYPWTIIHVDIRDRYLEALERASVNGDIDVFAALVAEQLRRTVELD